MAGNITGEVFKKEIIEQINARQKFLGARYKTDSHLIYGNNVNAFLRLASSVNVGTTDQASLREQILTSTGSLSLNDINNQILNQGKNQLKERGINENLTGMELAKACVLFGGTVGVDDKLNPKFKFGIVDNGGSATYDYVSSQAAYGWGGIGTRGFVPMPSIESADISFYNRGALAKASVKIKVYSLEQLQIFDVLYFRIGYTMLLEWGHNIWVDTNKFNQNDPFPLSQRTEFATKPFELFFKEGTTQKNIIDAIKDQRKKDSYNYDGMLGKVTNFTWKFNDDGSYDIDLNLIGMGDIVETLKINTANIITGKTDITPSQQRNKKKAAIATATTAKTDQKSKTGDIPKDAQKNFNNALTSYNSYVTSQNLPSKIDTNQTIALFLPAKELYEDVSIQTVKDVIFNLSDNSPFLSIKTTVDTAKTKLTEIKNTANVPDNRKAEWLQGINSIISILNTLSGKLKDLDDKQKLVGVKEQEATQADAQLQKELDALQNALKEVSRQEEIASLSPETSVEKKDKTALNKQLYLWRQAAKQKTYDKDNLYKLTLTANSANADSTGTSTLSLNFYYVRLGHLLEWIQNNSLYYDISKKTPIPPTQPTSSNTVTQSTPPLGNPIFNINYDPETNFCLRFPAQFSSDPRVCIIPSQYKAEGLKTDDGKATSVSWDILPDLQKGKGYMVDNNPYIGKLMNIFVNIDNIASKIDANTDANGKTSLLKFLTALLNDINDVLGNVNKLEATFDPEENELQIIEGSSLENVEKQIKEAEQRNHPMAIFQIYGIGTDINPIGSFITNVDFQVQLPPNMASMATISAQSSGNIVGENATALSKLNGGLTDRLITFKLDRDSIEGTQTGKLDPTKIFSNNIQYIAKTVKNLYQEKLFAVDTIDSIRSANRDIALYLTGNDALEGNMPPPFFIPFNLSLSMKGLAGMVNYERFSITEQVLPYSYRSSDQGGVIDFLIKGISHNISNDQWTTKIESLTVGSNRKTSLDTLQNTQAQQ